MWDQSFSFWKIQINKDWVNLAWQPRASSRDRNKINVGSRDDDQYEVWLILCLMLMCQSVSQSKYSGQSSPGRTQCHKYKSLEKYFCKDINIFITVSFKSHQGSCVCFDSSFVISDQEASSKSHQETHECLHGLEPGEEARDYCRESWFS